MPRNYKKMTTHFTEADIQSAFLLVKSGAESLQKAARTTGIPGSTSSRWVNNKNTSNFGSGRKTTIPLETEELLVDTIEFMGDLSWPIDKVQIKFIVSTFIQRLDIKSPFKENMPGDKWLNLFQNRWKHRLSQREPEYVTAARAKGLKEKVLNGFFTMFENLLDTLGIKAMPERLFNLGKTGFSLDPKKKCSFYHRGTKNVQMILSTEGKTMHTILFCGNAAGSYMPPHVIYKGLSAKFFDTWMIGGPEGTSCSVNKS